MCSPVAINETFTEDFYIRTDNDNVSCGKMSLEKGESPVAAVRVGEIVADAVIVATKTHHLRDALLIVESPQCRGDDNKVLTGPSGHHWKGEHKGRSEVKDPRESCSPSTYDDGDDDCGAIDTQQPKTSTAGTLSVVVQKSESTMKRKAAEAATASKGAEVDTSGASREPSLSLSPSPSPRVLLVVDDSAITRRVVMQMIQLKGGTSPGYRCIEADSGEQALKIISEALAASKLAPTSRLASVSVKEMPSVPDTTVQADCGDSADLTALEEGRQASIGTFGGEEGTDVTMISSTWPFAAVLVDYEMPGGLSGPETVRRLRQQLGYGGLVLGVTGYQSQETKQDFLSAGADDVLTKPLQFPKLASYILW
jgi:CheY-like chemotaxis protein